MKAVETREVYREEDVPVPRDRAWFDFTCPNCKTKHTLYYNGGELDHAECCGREYALESPTVDFVVRSSRG